MKYTMILLAALAALAARNATADEYVQGHIRRDGTYVEGHWRTERNDTKTDNYSSKPNVNPHTGQRGSVDPYKVDTTPSYPKSYGRDCGYNSAGVYRCK
jgi:hypothetical protein